MGRLRIFIHKKINEIKVNKYNFRSNKIYNGERIVFFHDGIWFESYSEEGVEELIGYYEKAKKDSQDDSLFMFIRNTGLKITNYNQRRAYISQSGEPKVEERCTAFYPQEHLIYIGGQYTKLGTTGVLLHELGHYVDYNNGKYEIGLEGCKNSVKRFLPSVFEDDSNIAFDLTFNKEFIDYYKKFRNGFNTFLKEVDEELKKEEHQKKIDEIARKQYALCFNLNDYESERYSEFKKQVYIAYKDSIIAMSGYHSISDMYDALTGGKLTSSLLIPENKMNTGIDKNGLHYIKRGVITDFAGHGSGYYKDKINMSTEIIAQISLLVNLGKTDLLYKFFPEDVVNGLLETYKSMIDYKEKYSNYDEQKKAM